MYNSTILSALSYADTLWPFRSRCAGTYWRQQSCKRSTACPRNASYQGNDIVLRRVLKKRSHDLEQRLSQPSGADLWSAVALGFALAGLIDAGVNTGESSQCPYMFIMVVYSGSVEARVSISWRSFSTWAQARFSCWMLCCISSL